MPSDDPLATGYDSFYEAWGRSPTWRQIWREHVTGPDYPDKFAHISFLPLAELRSLAQGLNLAADQTLVDLAAERAVRDFGLPCNQVRDSSAVTCRASQSREQQRTR
jgi:hypothetical protein